MENDQHKDIKKYIDLLLRWDKLILCSLLLALSCGLAIYLLTPKVYQSTSMIIYEQQKINPSKFSPDQEKQISEMVNTVSQQVTSRTSLVQIINQYGLYKELLAKLPIEDVVATMRDKDIDIQLKKSKGNIFSVTYQGTEPRQVMLVTNSLASKFVEENIRFREERASETAAYVNDELKAAKESIDAKEQVLRDYKLKFYNEMPAQREANMTRLNALQDQYQAIQANIQSLEQTKLLARDQFSLRQERFLSKTTAATAAVPSGAYDLVSARQALQDLLGKYTEEHPEVKQLKKRIRQLEEEQGAVSSPAAAAKDGDGQEQKTASGPGVAGVPADALALQIKEIDLNLQRLRQDKERVLKQIEMYQKWIEATPVREAEWASLTRNYDELKKHYELLVAQSLAAESAESLERRQKGSQFKIIEAAFLPEKPVQPDFKKIMTVALVLGLGVGGGLVLLFGFLDTSFHDAAEVEAFLGVPVICAMPVVRTEREKKKGKIVSVAAYALLALWLLCFSVSAAYLWHKGIIVV